MCPGTLDVKMERQHRGSRFQRSQADAYLIVPLAWSKHQHSRNGFLSIQPHLLFTCDELQGVYQNRGLLQWMAKKK